MAIQTKLGKAFEFASLNALNEFLCENQEVEIRENASLVTARTFYRELDDRMRDKMDLAARAGIQALLRLEPQLQYPNGNSPLLLVLQEDRAGQAGDVRDLLTIRQGNNWEVGLSCKHNHNAVKHSRLSAQLDFGDKWLGVPCSQQYFQEIAPLFEELRLRKSNDELWRDLEHKDERFYVPLLEAFSGELQRINAANAGQIPCRMVKYLLGRKDFYKLIAEDQQRTTRIEAFNLNGTLNRNSGDHRSETRIRRLRMPTRFLDIALKAESRNTLEVVCDNGVGFSMRIHNASSKIEPSLKFDITLICNQTGQYTHHEAW